MKGNRTLIVITVAVLTAAAASYGVYLAIQRMPVREVEVASVHVVAATDTLPVGVRLTADDLKVVAWPSRSQVEGAFSDPNELVGRGVIATIAPNELITSNKVASLEAGAGLPPIIPAGMRAMSVRVNEVIGVAGFVLPGTRVDVLVTARDTGDGEGRAEPMARTVVSNVQVLTAGTRYDQEESKDGKPVKSTVVTLAVEPPDGERIALAQSEGQISLALRNPLDVEPTQTSGIKLAALMRGNAPQPALATRPRAPSKLPAVALPPPPPPPPSVYTVEAIRAAKRSEEVVH